MSREIPDIVSARVFPPAGGSYQVRDYRPSPIDFAYMEMALEEAEIALELGNAPVGVVIANEKGDFWTGHSDEHSSRRLNGHAERNAIEAFNRDTGLLNLVGVSMYSTFVPCVGCAHAIDQGELSALYYAADRNDVINATSDDQGQGGAVRGRHINMPEILHDSPRTFLVIEGLRKATAVEKFVRKHRRDEAERLRLLTNRRKRS